MESQAKGGEGFVRTLKGLLKSGYPLVWVVTEEVPRFLRLLSEIGPYWSYDPLDRELREVPQGPKTMTVGFENVLGEFLNRTEPGILVLLGTDRKDALDWTLRLKAAYPKLLARKHSLLILSDTPTPPKELERFAYPLPLPPPDVRELGCLFEDVFSSETSPDNLHPDSQLKTRACLLLKGLLEHEAALALKRAMFEGGDAESFLRVLAREKVRALKSSSALVPIEPDIEVAQVGGLDRFKEWLQKRRPLFFRQLEEEGGLLAPKGVLLMGVAGTGKSLCAKVTAKLFGIPLLRLELSALFAQNDQENPDAVFLRTVEELDHLQPCVLWVDEIEKGFVSGIEDKGSSSSRISASFLTWMQERKSRIFVVATANRIMMLPAEILRRGRFDDVFFLDLPELEERKDIFGIQLERFGVNRTGFDLENLAEASKGFSGAEIEQVIKQALIDALAEDRSLTEADLYRSIGAFVPLSVTMFEQIKAIKKWAHDRAIPASSRTRF